MIHSNCLTYILDYTSRTIAAIELAASYSDHVQSPVYDVDVTTTEDNSIHRVGIATRRVDQFSGDRLVIDVVDSDLADLPYCRFDVPYTQAIVLAAIAHRELSASTPTQVGGRAASGKEHGEAE